MTAPRLYIDVTTGEVRAAKGAAPLAKLAFSSRDLMPLEVVFTAAGAEVTSEVLGGNATLLIGLRAQPGTGHLLALADTYTLAGEVASTVLSLNTEEVVDYLAELPAQWTSGAAFFEVQVLADDESTRQVLAQLPATIRRRVVEPGDVEPPPLEVGLYVLKTTHTANFADPTTAPSFAAGAWRTALSIDQVDNTSDMAKPVSTAQGLADASVQSAAALDATGKANAAAAFAVQRDNHTGEQAISTVTGLQAALDGKQAAGNYLTGLTGDVTAAGPGAATATVVSASETAAGKVELATGAETFARADNTRAVTPAGLAYVTSSIAPVLAAELLSAGVTSNRRVEWSLAALGALGALPMVLPFEFDVPASNPTATARIHSFAASGTAAFAANNFYSYLGTSGQLELRQYGATDGDYVQASFAGFVTAYAGRRVRGVIFFDDPNSQTKPKVYVAGVDVTASFAVTTTGSGANWMPAALVTTIFAIGLNWPAGRFVPHGPIVGAFTSAELVEWTLGGRWPAWTDVFAANLADLLTDFAPTNPGGGTAWGSFTAFDNNGFDAAVENAGGFLLCGWQDSGPNGVGPIETNAQYAVLYDYTDNRVGGSGPVQWRMQNALTTTTNTYTTAAVPGSNLLKPGTSKATILLCITAQNLATLALGIASGGSADVSIRNVRAVRCGRLFRPVIQPSMIVADDSANVIPGVITAGITPICPGKRDFVVQARTETNGNQQLNGAAPFLDYTKVVLDDWCVNNKGSNSRTISLGQASGGTQFANGATAAVGRNPIALASRVPGANALWCASAGTDALQHTIRGHLVD